MTYCILKQERGNKMKRNIHVLMAFFTAILIMYACAGAGKKFDSTHVNDIQKGVQSKAEIASWFGDPYQKVSPLSVEGSGCVERWIYVYAFSSYGGAKTSSNSLVVDFDSDGKVCDHAYQEVRQ
jgi:outer membrane protein assembly factor BamE (lipoprotein component of BamABCDE complex)